MNHGLYWLPGLKETTVACVGMLVSRGGENPILGSLEEEWQGLNKNQLLERSLHGKHCHMDEGLRVGPRCKVLGNQQTAGLKALEETESSGM